MRSAPDRDAPEELGGPPTIQPVALVGPALVVEAHEGLQAALHRGPAGEVPAPERDAPVLVQDRALPPLHEAVGPWVPRLRARVADVQGPAGLLEGPLKFRAAVGQHAPGGQAPRRESGARGSRRKPAVASAEEAGSGQLALRALGEQPAGPGAVILKQGQALAPRPQPGPAQNSPTMHGLTAPFLGHGSARGSPAGRPQVGQARAWPSVLSSRVISSSFPSAGFVVVRTLERIGPMALSGSPRCQRYYESG